ncbi:MAG: PAS domain S-box protein [Planctomycetes bacterium]|nr:PAS domain S-box protein [Planctomycetota bacterium]
MGLEIIKNEIVTRFGFMPPFFESFFHDLALLKDIWQQTVTVYLDSPIPGLFKEKLYTYLSRFCLAPYCLICHSCVLYKLGMKGDHIFKMLSVPPPKSSELSELIEKIKLTPSISSWKEIDSEMEMTIIRLCTHIYIKGNYTPIILPQLRRLLGDSNHNFLVSLMSYIQTCATWVESHRNISYKADQRVKDSFKPMVKDEPRLKSLFKNFATILKHQMQEGSVHELTSSIISSSVDGILAFDKHCCYTIWNPAMERISGLPKEKVIGKNAFEVFPFLQKIGEDRYFYDSLAGKTVFAPNRPFIIPETGHKGFFEGYYTPLRNDENEIIGGLGIIRDITEHKKIETALRESEELFKQLSEASSEGIAITRNGVILKSNNNLVKMFGYKHQSEVIGKHAIEFASKEYRELVRQKIIENDETPYECLCLRKDGSTFMTDIHGKRTTYNGKDARVTAIRDISLQKHTENKLRNYALQLEQLNNDLKDFNFAASHDLQEPLRKILYFTEMIKKKYFDNGNSDAIDHINRIKNATRRMQDLIDALLRLSMVLTKRKILKRINLNKIISAVISEFSDKILETKTVIKSGKLADLQADKILIYQLFYNLISNAIKFRKKGRQNIISISGKVIPDDQYEISISDRGIGFDLQYLDTIFKPFHRLHARTEYEGTGIGLSICKKIVSYHSGTMTAESKLGSGSTFVITIPFNPKTKDKLKTNDKLARVV